MSSLLKPLTFYVTSTSKWTFSELIVLVKTQDNFISGVHQTASLPADQRRTKPNSLYKELLQLSLAFRLVKQGAKAIKSSSSEIVVASFYYIKTRSAKVFFNGDVSSISVHMVSLGITIENDDHCQVLIQNQE